MVLGGGRGEGDTSDPGARGRLSQDESGPSSIPFPFSAVSTF